MQSVALEMEIMNNYRCEHCGNIFSRKQSQAERSKHIFCNQKCAHEFARYPQGKARAKYLKLKGGARVYEHRQVMENYLGRKLLPNEHVYRKNGDRNDNRIENLYLAQRKIVAPSAPVQPLQKELVGV